MDEMIDDKRQSRRYNLNWPVQLCDGTQGVSRNISVSGILFYSKQCYPIDHKISIVVLPRYLTDSPDFICCEGVVVRNDLYVDGCINAIYFYDIQFEYIINHTDCRKSKLYCK